MCADSQTFFKMNRHPTLLSIQVGKPRNYGDENAEISYDQPWTTGFFKFPVEGSVFVGCHNLAGDGQADLKNHGGPDKAVLAYSADHYPLWRGKNEEPSLPLWCFGGNIENADM